VAKVFAEMMTIMFLICYMFQPMLNEVYALRSYAVEMVLDSAIEKAAAGDNGRFTPEIIADMRATLKNELGYKDGEIDFNGTTTLTGRGEYVEGNLVVPHKRLWIMEGLFGQDRFEKKIEKYAKQMSEYIIRTG